MTALNNNFNGGPDSTTISTGNSGQFGDNAFDSVNLVGGVASYALFQTADDIGTLRPQTQFTLGLGVSASGNAASVSWSTSMGSQTTFWTRFYVFIANVSANTINLPLFTAYSSSTRELYVYIRTSSLPHVMVLEDSASVLTVGSVTPSAQAWIRLELGVNTTSDVATLNMYSGANLDGVTTTDTITQSTGVYATCNKFTYGFDGPDSGAQPGYFLSEIQLNNTGYPGPAPWRLGLGAPAGNMVNSIAIHSDVC
jgi:hypothetical protein